MDILSIVLPIVITIVVVGVVVVVMGLVFVPMLLGSMRRQKLMQTGVSANAQILSVWQTGMYVNEQPQIGMKLQVNPPNGQPFEAETKMVVSMIQIPQFQPGQLVEVKYDPAKPNEVAIASILQSAPAMGGMPGVMAGGMAGGASAMNPSQVEQMLRSYQAANEQISKTGLQARATIIQFSPMGINVNGNNPAVNLMLEVHPTTGPAFTSQAQGIVIAESSIPKYQPGQMITVRYNPNDQTRVAVERSGI